MASSGTSQLGLVYCMYLAGTSWGEHTFTHKTTLTDPTAQRHSTCQCLPNKEYIITIIAMAYTPVVKYGLALLNPRGRPELMIYWRFQPLFPYLQGFDC